MKRIPQFLAIVTVLALSVISCGLFSATPPTAPPAPSALQPAVVTQVVVPAPQVNIPPALDLASSQDALIQLYKNANPGVVAIRVLTPQGGALGSGFVIDDRGHIITNYHVVEGETDLEVAFSSGLKVRGKVIGTDLDSDLAVIAVDAPAAEIHPLQLGDSDQLQVGQAVVAIGNPFGLQGTMTVGIISGLGRTTQSQHTTADGGTFTAGNIIQTDAAINPGNSGGPLLNLNDEVVGVNQSIRTDSFTTTGEPTNSGVGFAISINIVKRVAPSLISNGKYDYPYLGVNTSGTDMTLQQQEELGLTQSIGVYVTGVTAGGPADRAGVIGGDINDRTSDGWPKGGDLIIAVDNRPVNNFNDLISYLVENKSPGDKVNLTVLRAGKQISIDVTLDKRPSP
jgi:S1-C subfamily serine protease